MRLEEIDMLEEQRVEALNSRNPGVYRRLCDDLGISPEDDFLYEVGLVDLPLISIHTQESIKPLKRRKRNVPTIVYKRFLDGAGSFSSNIGEHTDIKRELLIEYFPGQFGDEGTQPVCNMSDIQVGNMFNNLTKYAIRRTKSNQ